ncbi:HAMP domain-containing sensor histidine kinase [Streptomyces sp. NPDC047046]|uniref:HAMP domain-containing sensor histidine kinase n=1 Tax=Streptomyces sp. NPDC047046 TaxID=3155378 RepID=UPI0033E16F0C
MNRVVRRFRALPLRSRLSLLSAAAVAIAVAAVSVTCWFLVRGKLYDEVDSQLKDQAGRVHLSWVQAVAGPCPSEPPAQDSSQRPPSAPLYLQIVSVDYDHPCVADGSTGVVRVTAADRDLAADPEGRRPQTRDGTTTDGRDVRVLTLPVALNSQQLLAGRAVQIAVPLKDTRDTLNELALILLLVSGVGVIGAGAAGLWVARTGLRPVDDLSRAAEHIARTEDLTTRIPVEGDDEIARLSRSFNSMTASLAASHELQRQLIADAGHELRTPLTSLRTNIELLVRSEQTGRAIPPDDRRELLESVKAQMTELAALIGDLQELSRPDARQQGPLDIVGLHEVAETALARARLRGPHLTIDAELDPWFVRAHRAPLERAVVNILDNAVKFSPENGLIRVRLERGALTVRDHGPGIPAEDLPHVFDRFWRSPSARSLPGSGLGLSIVARTVRDVGGTVTLAPARDGEPGTLATITIPGAPVRPPGEAE